MFILAYKDAVGQASYLVDQDGPELGQFSPSFFLDIHIKNTIYTYIYLSGLITYLLIIFTQAHPSPLAYDGGDEVHVHLHAVKEPPALLIVAGLAGTLARPCICSLHTALQATHCTAAVSRSARTRAGAPALLTTFDNGQDRGGFLAVYLLNALGPQQGDSSLWC